MFRSVPFKEIFIFKRKIKKTQHSGFLHGMLVRTIWNYSPHAHSFEKQNRLRMMVHVGTPLEEADF